MFNSFSKLPIKNESMIILAARNFLKPWQVKSIVIIQSFQLQLIFLITRLLFKIKDFLATYTTDYAIDNL
ncbi:unnamed protein product [Blepharisma stoltei]|uniref:Uncharacterized protein n=1 Tax=Blepharisma stoltei TaxID=1481888 RepID=A0AAU9J9L7_9CILI|nr:unnamed protein product [Blepharisma stoltei]